jgi:hypothetical protein
MGLPTCGTLLTLITPYNASVKTWHARSQIINLEATRMLMFTKTQSSNGYHFFVPYSYSTFVTENSQKLQRTPPRMGKLSTTLLFHHGVKTWQTRIARSLWRKLSHSKDTTAFFLTDRHFCHREQQKVQRTPPRLRQAFNHITLSRRCQDLTHVLVNHWSWLQYLSYSIDTTF